VLLRINFSSPNSARPTSNNTAVYIHDSSLEFDATHMQRTIAMTGKALPNPSPVSSARSTWNPDGYALADLDQLVGLAEAFDCGVDLSAGLLELLLFEHSLRIV